MGNLKIQFSFCHKKPERSFFWKGKKFPLCARCTGIYLGYLSLPLFLCNFINLNILISILMIIPTYIDGFIQAVFNLESTNMRRLMTGFISGIGTMSLTVIISKQITHLLISTF
ncbi:DUF2085 domain-containing protein [Epilithonimonas caeni]|uniref:DUF2085 domain-containing protein n=1 Tax=Epilithonimonas caeni TaxID=365343 RepID=UPI0009FD2806|nr:DUF2085 domain-containing protein [Epilithonimonas caeni]